MKMTDSEYGILTIGDAQRILAEKDIYNTMPIFTDTGWQIIEILLNAQHDRDMNNGEHDRNTP